MNYAENLKIPISLGTRKVASTAEKRNDRFSRQREYGVHAADNDIQRH